MFDVFFFFAFAFVTVNAYEMGHCFSDVLLFFCWAAFNFEYSARFCCCFACSLLFNRIPCQRKCYAVATAIWRNSLLVSLRWIEISSFDSNDRFCFSFFFLHLRAVDAAHSFAYTHSRSLPTLSLCHTVKNTVGSFAAAATHSTSV